MKVLILVVIFVAQMTSVHASSKNPGKVIAGWVEKVTIHETGEVVKAKLDTGANTSSLHATDIKVFKRKGERWVRFKLKLDRDGDHEGVLVERQRERRVRIKEDEDQGDSRPVVAMKFCFNGRWETAEFTLNDREGYIYPVLLGRRFLAGIAVVDPEKEFLTQRNCEG